MARSRKTKSTRRSTRRVKIPRGVLMVERVGITTVPKAATTAGGGLYLNHQLNNFLGASDITSLFQEYKIDKIRLTFRLTNAPNNNASFPTLYIAPQSFNYLGAAPASSGEVWQFKGLKSYQYGPSALSFSEDYFPTYAHDVNTSAGIGNVVRAGWLSVGASAIQHMSAVYWIDRYDVPTNNSHNIELEAKLFVSCKNPR